MENCKLSLEQIEAIEEIIAKGNTAEIKRRKDDVIVMSVSRKIKVSSPQNGVGKK